MNIYNKLITISNDKQVAYSFDKATLVKILKGALISGTGAMALYILDVIGKIDFTNINVAALVSFLVPFLVNLIKEYIKGTK